MFRLTFIYIENKKITETMNLMTAEDEKPPLPNGCSRHGKSHRRKNKIDCSLRLNSNWRTA